MSALLYLEDGSLVPVASLSRIGHLERDGRRAVRDAEGRLIGRASEHAIAECQDRTLPIIPAQPGWLIVTYAGPDDDEFWSVSEPVIGWVIDGSFPLPVTASSGFDRTLVRYVLVAPAGTGATLRAFGADASYRGEREALDAAERQWREARPPTVGALPVGCPP